METSTRTSKQKVVKNAIASAYDNMAVEQAESKDIEKLCPDATFNRNLTSFSWKKVLITMNVVLTLITLVSVTVNIFFLTGSNLHCDCEDISTFQTDDGANYGIMRSTLRAECTSAPCQNEATCNEAFTCDCMPGYEGITCGIDIDECVGMPCLNEGTCVDGVDDFLCVCTPGYEGELCEIDVDECLSEPCLNDGICEDGVDSFICDCMPGFQGTFCETDIDECLSQPCENDATCIHDEDSFICVCVPGYEGVLCETDLDECASQPCLNGGTCHDGVNSFSCDCVLGYEGTFCQKGKSYVVMLGGDSLASSAYSECDVYDVSGDRSNAFTVPSLPEPRQWAAVVDTEDSLFMIGGYENKDTMYKLTKATMIWDVMSPMNQGRFRFSASAVEVNNAIIAVGGYVSSGYTASVEMYDVKTDSWRILSSDSDYPMTIDSHASCGWRDEVYVSGGWSTETQAGVYKFSLETERWTWFADLTQERSHHSMVAVDDHLYVLDGTAPGIEMYDESTGKFNVIAESPLDIIYNTNAVVIDSNIITAGGYDNDQLVTYNTVTGLFNFTFMDLRRDYASSHVALMLPPDN